MNNTKLIKAILIIVGSIWAIFLIGDWINFLNVRSQLIGNPFLGSQGQELLVYSMVFLIAKSSFALMLIIFGIRYNPEKGVTFGKIFLGSFYKGKLDSPIDGVPHPDTHVKCPDCREFILKDASVCKHCGCKLMPQ